MIRAEYIRFLQGLNVESTPNEVRKLANLVLQHLDALLTSPSFLYQVKS